MSGEDAGRRKGDAEPYPSQDSPGSGDYIEIYTFCVSAR